MNELNDAIVEEIRTFRAEHAQRFDGNLAAICDDLRRIQQESHHSIVAFPPKKIRRPSHVTSQQAINERMAA
ncbi:MAG: hypothetical protein JW725_05520 [Candidatus Babeliaceae bacterium]|nr:hypothetical protein [Candidatus Babeliaceae bacterium]